MGLRGRWARGALLGAAAVAAGVLPGTAGAAPAEPAAGAAAGSSAAVVQDGPASSPRVFVREGGPGDRLGRHRPRRRRRRPPDRVAADIVRPREPRRPRVPVIMDASPYYPCCGRGNESELKTYDGRRRPRQKFPLFYDNYFVPRGYAVVLVDLAGTTARAAAPTSAGPRTSTRQGRRRLAERPCHGCRRRAAQTVTRDWAQRQGRHDRQVLRRHARQRRRRDRRRRA